MPETFIKHENFNPQRHVVLPPISSFDQAAKNGFMLSESSNFFDDDRLEDDCTSRSINSGFQLDNFQKIFNDIFRNVSYETTRFC
jgi:hypothetical protein